MSMLDLRQIQYKSWMVQWLRCPPVTRETGVRFPVRELFAFALDRDKRRQIRLIGK